MLDTAQFPVSKIKITPPSRRPEIVSRPRLIEKLHEQFDKKLILLVAPAGYGKSTILLDLATSSEIPVCWLTLDSLDQEPQRFLTYIVASIAYRFPGFGKESSAALESMISVEADGERVLIAITNEIRSRIFEHFVLILDDYHLVDASPDVRRLVSRFVQLGGENVHLLLSSRSLPNIPNMPLLVARDMVSGMSFEDLAFQPEEIRQYFIQNVGQAISEEEAAQIASETEGWIAAIHLTNALAPHRMPARPFSALADLFDFFTSEVLDKQTPELREFLLITSMFEAFDAELCQAVLDPLLSGETRPWAKLIGAVQANNVFTVPLGDDGRWMRYHNMFKQFLASQLQYEQPTLSWHVQKNLAQYYEAHQSWEEALHLYDSLGDRESLVAVFAKAGIHFINSGRILTLANWLTRLPLSVQQEDPVLLSLQGVVDMTQGNPQLGVSLLSQAEEMFRKRDDRPSLALTLTRRATGFRQLGQFRKALEDAEQALSLAQEFADAANRATAAEALRVKGQALFRLDQLEEALACLKEALSRYSSLGIEANVPMLEMEIGMLYLARGDHQTTLSYYQHALGAWEESGNLGWKAILLNNMGFMYHQEGRFVEAFTTLEDALIAAEQSGFTRTQALAQNSLGDLLLDVQDTQQAASCHARSLELATQLADSFLMFHERLAQIRLARQDGGFDRAYALLLDLLAKEEERTAYREALLKTEEGCCLLGIGQPVEASAVLQHAIQLLLQGGRTRESCALRLWLVASLGQVDPAAGLAEFDALMSQGCNLQSPGPLYVTAVQCYPWLSQLAENASQAHEPFRRFLYRVQKYGDDFASIRRQLRHVSKRVEISPPKIEVRALGPAQIIRDGQLLTLSDWQTHEARDLFFFLLFSAPQTKEQIALVFWPDISPARLRMRFKTDVYRIRQALGQNAIVFEDEFYRFNRAVDYSSDVDEFHALLEDAHKAGDPERSLSALRTAVDLVQGTFLADMDFGWVLEVRIRLAKEYYGALFELAEAYLSVAEAEQCLSVTERLLALDPVQEKVHRLRMRAFAAHRDRAGLVRQFQECREVLQRELGVLPSNETAMLFELLVH